MDVLRTVARAAGGNALVKLQGRDALGRRSDAVSGGDDAADRARRSAGRRPVELPPALAEIVQRKMLMPPLSAAAEVDMRLQHGACPDARYVGSFDRRTGSSR